MPNLIYDILQDLTRHIIIKVKPIVQRVKIYYTGYDTQHLIVLDHFHVKKYLNDAVDIVRKEELSKARKTENSELAEVLHCNKRFILMQNKNSKKRENILERLRGLNEQVYKAMLLKDQFLSVYKSDDRRTAQTNLKQWIVAAIGSGVSAFVELGYKFFSKRHFVLNYFVHKITSAISEGINNKIKRMNYSAASSGVSKSFKKNKRPKGRGK